MKRRNRWFTLMALVLASSMTLSSCIGSFSLTNKLLAWNRQVSDKFVNEVVFFAFWILPVYEVSALADLLVLNSIEFWSGNQPLTASTEVVEGSDGLYTVERDAKGYTVTSHNDGSVVRLDYSVADNTWSYSVGDGAPVPFMTFVDDTHVSVPGDNGAWRVVELSRAGVAEYAMN